MFGSVRRRLGEGIGEFQRTFLNQGYVESLIEQSNAAERDFEAQLAAIVGKLAIEDSQRSEATPDEVLILRDQLFELERGRRELGEDTTTYKQRADEQKTSS